jgi:hypothetical protein
MTTIGGFGLEITIGGDTIVDLIEGEIPKLKKFLAEATPQDATDGYTERVATGKRSLESFKVTLGWDADDTTHDAIMNAFNADAFPVRQVETATVVGTVSGSGNAEVVVTAAGMTNSPKTVSVAVLNLDTASVVAGKIRAALALDADVSAFFTVSGTGTAVVLTCIDYAANDATINIAIDNDTCTGLTTAATSANTVAGVAVDYVEFEITTPGADEVITFMGHIEEVARIPGDEDYYKAEVVITPTGAPTIA